MYNPLPESLTINESKIHGLGLFAIKDIPLGTDLGISHVKHPDFPQGWLRTPLGGFYNHTDTPNCKLKSAYVGVFEDRLSCCRLITIKNIKKGDEITCSYSLWNDDNEWKKNLEDNSF